MSLQRWHLQCLQILSTIIVVAGGAGSAMGLTTTGSVVLVSPPPSVLLNAFESNSELRLFEESTTILAVNLAVDITTPGSYTSPGSVSPGVIGAGTSVTSFFVQLDTVGSSLVTGIGGTITFDSDILGVIVFDGTLNASDTTTGAGSVAYPTGLANRGIELSSSGFLDQLTLSGDLRTLSIDQLAANFTSDQLRIITVAVPEPGTAVLVGGGLVLLAAPRRRRAS